MRGINQTAILPGGVEAAYSIQAMERHDVIEAVEQHPDSAWLKRAMRPGEGKAELLGLFWVQMGSGKGPRAADALWPAVLLHVTFEGRRRTVVLYRSLISRFGWKTMTRMTDKVPWPAWAGRADGEVGTVNGDKPARGAEPAAASPAGSSPAPT